MSADNNRPLSPHLEIYRWQITMTLSILHRATGVVLSGGALLLVAWLVAIASGAEAYKCADELLRSIPGMIVLAGWIFSMYYHLCNGIRHLFWDMGKGFSMKGLYAGGYIMLACALTLTGATWACLFL